MARAPLDTRNDALQHAIERAGGVAALARGLGISQPSLSAWRRVPAERVLAVEALTGVARSHLRPDLYPLLNSMQAGQEPPSNEGSAEVAAEDDIDLARAREYLLLATLLTGPPTKSLLTRIAALAGDDSLLGRAHAALATAARANGEEGAGREYFSIFVGVGRGEVLPYASYYRTGFLNGRPLAHLREDMAQLGIVRREDVFEPEDHLGVLLEVMAILIGGNGNARHRSEPDVQARFFREHIQPWGERAFADIGRAPSAMLYGAVAELGRLWLAIEREGLALPG